MSELSDTYKKIEDLMGQKFWLEAHRACLEFLKIDPENIRVIRYKNRIEKEVLELNRKAIQEDLDNLKPLWNAKKYTEIISHLEKLRPYVAAFPRIGRLLKKAQKALEQQQCQQFKNYYQGKKEIIMKFMSQKQFQQALNECEQLSPFSLKNPQVIKFIRNIKDTYIDEMMVANQNLLQSQQYDNIIAFYQKMLSVQPLSQKVQRLLRESEKRKRQSIIAEKRDFIYKGLEEIRILFQLKKYEKVRQAAKEILIIDPTNKVAKKWLRLSQKRLDTIAEVNLISQMKENQQVLKKQFSQKRSDFVKI